MFWSLQIRTYDGVFHMYLQILCGMQSFLQV